MMMMTVSILITINKKALLTPRSARDSSAAWWIAAVAEVTFFSYPSRIRCPRSLSCRWNFRVPFCVRKLESWGYTVVKIAWSYVEPSLTDPPVWQTDRQTDGRALAKSAL